MKRLMSIIVFSFIIALSIQAHAATLGEQRVEVQQMKFRVLDRLYKAQPGTKEKISKAAGYAVFSSADVAYIFFSGSYGHGLAHNNRSSDETYMQMASAGIGLGLGVKDYRVVFIFNTSNAYNNFINTGLDLSGHADLAAKQGSNGGAVSGAVMKDVEVYQLTDTGLMAQAMLKGTKYWRDEKLNSHNESSQAGAALKVNN